MLYINFFLLNIYSILVLVPNLNYPHRLRGKDYDRAILGIGLKRMVKTMRVAKQDGDASSSSSEMNYIFSIPY